MLVVLLENVNSIVFDALWGPSISEELKNKKKTKEEKRAVAAGECDEL